MPDVVFVDTTIVCNILPVPGRDQARETVLYELQERIAARQSMILPMAAIVETGNFIAHVSPGGVRRSTAARFDALLRLVLNGSAPWELHSFAWDDNFLRAMLDGGAASTTLVEHAIADVGGGDVCILTERETYNSRTGLKAGLWTHDARLRAYA